PAPHAARSESPPRRKPDRPPPVASCTEGTDTLPSRPSRPPADPIWRLPPTRDGALPERMAIGLSIRHPWAELILRGRQRIEVRTWATRHRGELWLHAGTTLDAGVLRTFGLKVDTLAVGALVGSCELYDCVEFTAETWERWRDQHLNSGPLDGKKFAWFLRDV